MTEGEERRQLMDRLLAEEGTLADAEHLLARLIEITPWFYGSDRMLGFERGVESRRIRERLEREWAGQIDRAKLIELVQKIMDTDGTEEEIDAYTEIVGRNVPCRVGFVSDLIFWPDKERTAEEIVDLALAYMPIAL